MGDQKREFEEERRRAAKAAADRERELEDARRELEKERRVAAKAAADRERKWEEEMRAEQQRAAETQRQLEKRRREAEQAAADRQRKLEEEMQAEKQRAAERERRYEEERAAQKAALENAVDEYQKLVADSKARKEEETDPTSFQEKKREAFATFCEKVEKLPDAPKTKKPSVAVVGQNGVGKSSLINTLVGFEVTETGEVDTTKVISKCYESKNTEFFDVPGDTPARSYYNLKELMHFREMHLILLVYSTRVDYSVDLFQMVKACKVPCLVVRNKTDMDINEKKARKKGKTLVEFKEWVYEQDFSELRKVDPQVKLCFVSAEEEHGIEDLRKAPALVGSAVSLQPDVE